MKWISVKDRLPEKGQNVCWKCVPHRYGVRENRTLEFEAVCLGINDITGLPHCDYDNDDFYPELTHWTPKE